ncbi:cytochrome P450 family protein [Hespellia stercorisuis]|uniref:HipA N-terminal domain-containing protein n=1 Tax=Hespellia stercorisuis DSM 15480 TaxID=1121950 RepID=A0A1M6IAM6_9FIRM|nr:HipA N-terminal domain-containing protein [Hespellia stercorisuis]SHJ31475.1 HipA N-terminal domain-containing protein [Hespellia stercorisuis DSM 15480]
MGHVNEIYVYENWKADTPTLMGTLYVDGGRGKQVVSFAYADEWINDLTNTAKLDPDLGIFKGRQYVQSEKSMFGVFSDSCPDRWGRLLMKRREALLAKKEERKPKTLTEIDFLLGVYDETRMGGLRFSTEKGGLFLSNDRELATPPWTTLRKLESASLAFEKNDDGMEEKWLKQLIAPGSSLGGARPKASSN